MTMDIEAEIRKMLDHIQQSTQPERMTFAELTAECSRLMTLVDSDNVRVADAERLAEIRKVIRRIEVVRYSKPGRDLS